MNKGQNSEAAAAPQNEKKFSIFTPYVEPSKGKYDHKYNVYRLQGYREAFSVRQCKTALWDACEDQFQWHEAKQTCAKLCGQDY